MSERVKPSPQQQSADTRLAEGTAGKRYETIFGLSICSLIRYLGSKGYEVDVIRETIRMRAGEKVAAEIDDSTYSWQQKASERVKNGNPRKYEAIPRVDFATNRRICDAAKDAEANLAAARKRK